MNTGEEFIHKKYPEQHAQKEVEHEQKRRKMIGEKTSQKPAEKLAAWFEVIKKTHGHFDDPQVLERIKNYYHKEYVIKPEVLPQSYWNLQKKIARERGQGYIEITDDMKSQHTEVIIADQKSTLDNWINYFSSPDSESYPIWAKYWAFRSMVGLSGYDKEKHAFGKRKKDTVAPFPDLNREALAYVVDIIVKKANKEKIEAEEGNPELWELIKGENFGKLYAYAIEKVTSTEKSELLITAGQWVKFDQGSDHMPLVDSLQGHGTGWCTAGESTAKVQLQTGDFYVYYTNDKNGQPKIPRIAIRMDSGSIAEVRGIAPDQNLDPYIGDVVKEKLKEFPDGKEYEKKSEDMKRLTDIEKKQQLNEDLSIEEIKFLYELEVQIQGFGYNADPRIEEIKKQRDQKKDYALIFDCHPDEVTLLREDPTEKTKVLKVDILNTQLFNIRKSLPNLYAIIGSLAVRGDNKELPAGLTYISRDLNLENSQLEKLPASLAHIGGELDIRYGQFNELPASLTKIGGDLNLSHFKSKELRASLISIGGNLNLEKSLLEELPASLTRVDGTILLQGCPLKKLPEALAHIGGHLDLRESRIEDLPDSLTYIGKNIFIGHCPLKKLPEALAYIGGGLYLEDSQVKKLPAGLTHIGRDLIINNPEFQELPDCLAYIGGDLWLGNAPIKKLPAALTYVGGDVTLGDTEIQEMPAGLTRIRGELDLSNLKSKELRSSLIYIDGDLDLQGSLVEKLPETLRHIGGKVNLTYSQVKEFPAGIDFIGGELWIYGSKIEKLPVNIDQIVKGKIDY